MAQDRPAWRDLLARALERSGDRPSARWLQLATVRPDHRPANRTVVFRGLARIGGEGPGAAVALRFAVDARHGKVEQAGRRPWGEACWYFEATREQFRLLGRLAAAGPDAADRRHRDERRAVWHELSAATRVQYAWPRPGAPRAPDPAFDAEAPDAAAEPPATFALLLLEPVEVDYLDLAARPHARRLFRLEDGGAWSAAEVNP